MKSKDLGHAQKHCTSYPDPIGSSSVCAFILASVKREVTQPQHPKSPCSLLERTWKQNLHFRKISFEFPNMSEYVWNIQDNK